MHVREVICTLTMFEILVLGSRLSVATIYKIVVVACNN